MRFRCRIGWHNWGQWGTVKIQNAEATYAGGSAIDVVVLTQETVCDDCLLVQRHTTIKKGQE